ncbi:MAG: hypothetical protein Kow00108_20310 [Calditrichia bacterium]
MSFNYEILEKIAKPGTINSGKRLYVQGKVEITEADRFKVKAKIHDRREAFCEIRYEQVQRRFYFVCSCKHSKSKICRHLVALGMEIMEKQLLNDLEDDPVHLFPIRILSRKLIISEKIKKDLKKLPVDTLADLLLKAAKKDMEFGENILSEIQGGVLQDPEITIDNVKQLVEEQLDLFDWKNLHKELSRIEKESIKEIVTEEMYDLLGVYADNNLSFQIYDTILDLLKMGRFSDAFKVALGVFEAITPAKIRKLVKDYKEFDPLLFIDFFELFLGHNVIDAFLQKSKDLPEVTDAAFKEAVDMFFERKEDIDFENFYVQPWFEIFMKLSNTPKRANYLYSKLTRSKIDFQILPFEFKLYILVKNQVISLMTVYKADEVKNDFKQAINFLKQFEDDRTLYYFFAEMFFGTEDVRILKYLYEHSDPHENPFFYMAILHRLFEETDDIAYFEEGMDLTDPEKYPDIAEKLANLIKGESFETLFEPEEDDLDIDFEDMLGNSIDPLKLLEYLKDRQEYRTILELIQAKPYMEYVDEYIRSINNRYPEKLYDFLTDYIQRNLDIADDYEANLILKMLTALYETFDQKVQKKIRKFALQLTKEPDCPQWFINELRRRRMILTISKN